MLQTRKKAALTLAVMTLVVWAFIFVQMLIAGREPGPALLVAGVMWAFSMLMGIAAYAYNDYLQRRALAGKKQADEDMGPQQQRTVEIDLPFDAAFDLALAALQALDGQPMPQSDDLLVRLHQYAPGKKQSLRIYESDREMGSIRAGLRVRLLGINDPLDFSRISLRLQRLDAGTTRVRIESRGHNLFDVYDMGKNLHYVSTLARFLRRESQPPEAPARLLEADDNWLDDESERPAAASG